VYSKRSLPANVACEWVPFPFKRVSERIIIAYALPSRFIDTNRGPLGLAQLGRSKRGKKMSLFDQLSKQVLNSLSGSGGQNSDSLVNGVLKMLLDKEGQLGGLSALAQSFQEKGLGDLVSSWIGTGENLPISAAQISQGFGQEQLKQFAESAGLPTESASSKLAEILPMIVDKLTPDGKIPESGLLAQGLNFLKASL
jgi:uncharacterized protein YidB (DUF937 family)